MPEVAAERSTEDTARNVATTAWALLLIWVGAALLLSWGWGVGLVGAGAILLGAQVARGLLRVKVDGFGLVAGIVLVVCGVGSLVGVAVDVFPVLFIVAGLVLLVSLFTPRRRLHRDAGELHGHPQPRG